MSVFALELCALFRYNMSLYGNNMSNLWINVKDNIPDTWDICGIGVSTPVLTCNDSRVYEVATLWVVNDIHTWRKSSGNLIKNVTHWKNITHP